MPKNKDEINIIGTNKRNIEVIPLNKKRTKLDNKITISQKKEIIKKEQNKIKEKNGKSTLNQKDKKKAHKKAKRKISKTKLLAIIAALGIAGIAAHKYLPEPKQEPKTTENQKEKSNDNFKEKYQVSQENIKSDAQREVESQINELENESDVLAYLKNMYIEKYAKKTGDETLTTADIMIFESSENYVYEDQDNNRIITHGSNPMEVEEELNSKNIDYNVLEDVKTYDIQTKDGKIIDSIILQQKDDKTIPVKVIPGDSYDEMKNYDSILDEMGTIIPNGIKYIDNFQDMKAKENFVKSIMEMQNEKGNLAQENENEL